MNLATFALCQQKTCFPPGNLPDAVSARPSDLRVKVEEGIQTLLELRLDLLARALQNVHGHVRLVAVGELEGRVVDLGDLALGEQPQSVDKSQIRHENHLIGSWAGGSVRLQSTRELE